MLSAVLAVADGAAVPVLARVDAAVPISRLGLPVYACLRDRGGQDYALVIATADDLARSTWPHQVLEEHAVPENYVIASPPRFGRITARRTEFAIVHDDGIHWIVRAGREDGERLISAGFSIVRLTGRPIDWTPPVPVTARVKPADLVRATSPNPLVAEMLQAIQESDLLTRERQLTGLDPVTIGGSDYTITTRDTGSGEPIAKATQFVYERLEALGLATEYHDWDAAARNVVATQPGIGHPDEIVIAVAHLDDRNGPGADDNASGSIAVMAMAEVCRRYRFDRTLRFLLVTGEEQGLLGSAAYAQMAYDRGDNIVAVFNMDMISYNTESSAPVLTMYTRPTSDPGYSGDQAMAQAFVAVVAAYGLQESLQPTIRAEWMDRSDHGSFWRRGYSAILAIEDWDDFNPYYHSAQDTIGHIDWNYFTSFAKAATGTVVELAGVVGRVRSRDIVLTGIPGRIWSCLEPDDADVFTPDAGGAGYRVRPTQTASFQAEPELAVQQ